MEWGMKSLAQTDMDDNDVATTLLKPTVILTGGLILFPSNFPPIHITVCVFPCLNGLEREKKKIVIWDKS